MGGAPLGRAPVPRSCLRTVDGPGVSVYEYLWAKIWREGVADVLGW